MEPQQREIDRTTRDLDRQRQLMREPLDVSKMLKLDMHEDGCIRVIHYDSSPTVYLDHWALRYFSEQPSYADRLMKALNDKEGTFAISWVNIAEFSTMTDENQARRAEALLEAALPRVFFLDVQFFDVISREDTLLLGGQHAPPHADQEFVKAFCKLRPSTPAPFTAHDLFTVAQQTDSANGFRSLADTIVNRVNSLRDHLDSDHDFQRALRRPPHGPRIQRGTRHLLREFVRAIVIDGNTPVTCNHAIDLLHAVVPIAYCDFVLLDKHWQTQAARVRQRIADAGMSFPIAKVYSQRAGGVDRFLSDVESD